MTLPAWLSPDTWAGASLAGLFLYSFLAATLLPGGSELALFALVRHSPDATGEALALATVGNTLGSLTSYACGRFLPDRVPRRLGPVETLRRWGSPALLFAWTPIVGDLLCVAAGWLRIAWLPCAICIAVGKFARYWLVVQGAALSG